MPAKGSTFDNYFLKLIFNATGIPNLADNTATSPLTNLYVSLHTASPGVSGYQNTSEAAYTGYSRVAMARSAAGWTVPGSSVSPATTIIFPPATGGSETEGYFGIGTASSGAGTLLYFGAISPTIVVSNGVTPELTTASTITEA